MVTGVDSIDLAILKALKKDARASFRDIAASTKVAVGTVQNRITKLRQNGILTGFAPTIDYSKIGFKVNAIIGLRIRRERSSDLVARLKNHPNVMSVYEVTGDIDMFVRVVFETSEELNTFLHKTLTEDYVISSITYIVLDMTRKNDLIEKL